MDEHTAKIINRMQGEIDRLKPIELPTRTCSARYTTNAGQSIGSGGSATIINFEDLRIDTDSAVTVGAAWKFTCPAGKGGYYHVDVSLLFTSTATWAAAEYAQVDIYKGGARYSTLYRSTAESATTLNKELTGSDVVSLAVGEYLDIRVFQNSGGALTLQADGLYNHVAISRI